MKRTPLQQACVWVACAAAIWACTRPVLAQPAEPLREAVQRALATNPQVTGRLNAYRAAAQEQDAARGGFLPRVDLTAGAGRTRDRLTARSPQTQTFGQAGVALSATQLLWDGLGTYNEVQRSDHARLARYFEFLDASDQVALEALRAYVDVARTRELVGLARDNVNQHRQVMEQIQSRFSAGVGRGVDLEQANARLALAESNLSTETSNLHDVTERYVRVVGSLPPALMPVPATLGSGLPGSSAALLEQTVRRNAGIAAAVESLRAAQSQARQRNSAFQPRVEAQVRSGVGKNLDGIQSQKNDTSAGVALTWNLFNGGTDVARQRQAAYLLNQAADVRDQACRDVRQNALVAFNDARKLVEQAAFLQRNVDATTRARDAYRQQFDIGQRSLLDVLNAENELFGSRRALTNANFDVHVARARAQAAGTQLATALGLTRGDGQADAALDLGGWDAGTDAAARCPTATSGVGATVSGGLPTAAGVVGGTSPVAPLPVPPAPPVVTPLPSAAAAAPSPAATVAPAAPDPAPPAAGTSVSQRLLDWNAAWNEKDAARYRTLYAPSFKAPGGTEKWFAGRAWLMRKPDATAMKISNVQRRSLARGRVETSFDVEGVPGTTRKTLVWQRTEAGDWLIVAESGR